MCEDFLPAADHKAQGAVDGLRLTAGDRGIQHLDALLPEFCVDLFGSNRIDGRTVNENSARLHVGSYAVLAQHDFLHLRGVGQHGDDHVALLADLLLRSTLRTGRFQLLHGSLTTVVDQQVGIARLQQIFCHRFAHDAQTDKTNSHSYPLPKFKV